MMDTMDSDAATPQMPPPVGHPESAGRPRPMHGVPLMAPQSKKDAELGARAAIALGVVFVLIPVWFVLWVRL